MHTEMNEKKNTCVGDEEALSERSLKPVCAVDMGVAWWGSQSLRLIKERQSLLPRNEAQPEMAKPFLLAQVRILTTCTTNVQHSFLPLESYSLKAAPLQRPLLLRSANVVCLEQLHC